MKLGIDLVFTRIIPLRSLICLSTIYPVKCDKAEASARQDRTGQGDSPSQGWHTTVGNLGSLNGTSLNGSRKSAHHRENVPPSPQYTNTHTHTAGLGLKPPAMGV